MNSNIITSTLFSLLVESQSVFFGAGMELNTDPSGDKVDTYFCAPPKAPINAKDLLFNSLIFLFICKIKLTKQLHVCMISTTVKWQM